ncbi:MAG: TIGR02206 family membrane protein [Chloroflexi bacterium]|nr:MAG: TIGR02206 family membrane protein [Chloroflexota bacterium]
MSGLLATEHVAALFVIAVTTVGLVVAARKRPGEWLKVLAVVLVVDEVSWWVYLLFGGVPGSRFAQSLPLQLCDVAILVTAAALWTRNRLAVEVSYFWGLAGTIQALFTPDVPQHFPSYPYFQYYIAHGGVVAASLILVVGMRLHPRPWAVVRVAGLTIAYAALVGITDAVTGANYMYLRSKPPSPTLLDVLGPWPVYIFSATLIAFVLFAILDAPFTLRRALSSGQRGVEALR